MKMCQLHPGAAQQSGARERDITIERIDIVVLPSIEDNLCTDSNSSTYNWLRDSLSNDFPLTRILLFHHSEGCITHTSIGLDQYLLDTLLRLRKRDPFRPIIFIADSRRSVFLRGALANSVHKAVYKSIKESVRGIVFLSTTAGRATYTPPPHTSRSLYSILHASIARDPIKLSGPYHDKPYSIQSPEAPVKSCKTLHCPSFLAYWNTLRIVSLQSLEASQASCKRPSFSNHWPSESGSVVISYGKTAKFNSLDREQYCVLRDSVSWLIQWVYELEPIRLEIGYEDFQLLHHLYPDDLLSIENDISDPLNGTCAWIWSNATFQAWLDSETDRRLLISGKGGSGKSVLAKYIARSLAADNRPSHSLSGYSIGPWRYTGRVVGVYCDYKFPPQSAESIFRYILHQLLADSPALIKDISRYVKSTRDWPLGQAIALVKIYLGLTKHKSVYLVFDGLDECDGAVQRDVDNTLETWSQETSAGSLPVRLKVLMTSRQYVPLLRGIGPGIDLAQDECAPGLSHDAFLVVGAGVESLHKLDERMVKALTPTIENLIFGENTVGVLLWARLASNSAQSLSCAQSDADSLLRYLTNLPTSLFALYDLIFDQLHSKHPQQSRVLFKALTWLCVSKRPLAIPEFYAVLEIEGGCHTPPSGWLPRWGAKTKPRWYGLELGIVLEVRSGSTIQFIHPSVQEFLLGGISTNGQRHTTNSAGEMHMRIARHCFSVLICAESGLSSGIDNRKISPLSPAPQGLNLPREHVLLDYAATYWHEHFAAGRYDTTLTRSFDTFINPKSRFFTRWFNIWWDNGGNQGSNALSPPKYLTKGIVLSFLGRDQEINRLLGLNSIKVTESTTCKPPWTLLSAAAWSGHRAVVELLLHRGLGDQTLLRQTSQALIYAIERGHTEVAKVIVTAFPHPSTNLDIQKMAIFESTRTRDLALVKWLVQRGANINAYEDGESLLDVALSEGDLAIVETLLDEGIDTHQTLRSTSRVIKAHATEKLRLIIKLGCNMEQVDEQGQTVLHTAALCGSLILVKLLLDSGVSVGGRDKKGHTALHHAVRSGNIATVKLLSDHELRPSIQDLMEACEQASVQIVDYLLRLGLDARSILNGRSAIHHVLCKRDPDNGIPLKGNLFHEKSRASTISLLIEMGADVNYKDSMGNTALHHSCNRREKRVTKVLLDCGAELDQVNGNGDTPLDLAVAHGDSELTLLLLNSTQLGLRANNTTWKNALKGGNFDAVQCLFADGLFLEPQSLDPQPSAVFEYFLSSNNVPDYFSNAIGLLKKLGVVKLSDVRVETENAYSFPNSIKESFEDITGTLWNWWPLQDPIPALRHDEAWVLWKHASYDRRACRIKVPLCNGENIKDLQSYITKLENLHLPHYPKSPSLDTPILKHDPNTHPLLRLRAPYQFTVPEGSENSPSVRHSALNGQDGALELQSMRSSSKSPRQCQRRDSLQSQLPDQPDQTQSNTNEDQDHGRFVLCMPKPLLLEHIDMRLIKNDSQFLDDLLQRYRGHRGFFKKFFSIMRFHHWGFDKYTVFERRIHPTSTGSKMDSYLPIDAPHDREYDFKRVDIGESPPIPQRVFYRHCLSRPNRLYRTLSGLNIKLGRRYRDPERGDIPRCSGNRELVDRVPKRYRQWLLDSDEFDTAFGLSAFELPSLLGFMCYSICIFLITIVFGALWISVWGHPADLQNATIPAVAFVMLWIFMYQGVRGKPWNRDEDY